MDYCHEKIVTPRLLLQPVSRRYERDIFKAYTGEVAEYMISRAPQCLEETILFVELSITELSLGNALQLVVLDRKTELFLGFAGIFQTRVCFPEMGLWLKKEAQGRGYGFEIVSALLRWAAKNLPVEALLYPVDVRNIPSRRIPEKLGAPVGKTYKVKNEEGKLLDVIEYKLLLSAVRKGSEVPEAKTKDQDILESENENV